MFKKILETAKVYNELLLGRAVVKKDLNLVKQYGGFRKAFTLAEVLITLGVIGVVAALTLPTLIQNHQKQSYVVGLKKAYSILSNAYSKLAIDEGVTDWTQTECARGVGGDALACFDLIRKQINVIEYNDNSSTCSGKLCDHFGLGEATQMLYLVTNDGMIFNFTCGNSSIEVDVNGEKGPNIYGRDMFRFINDSDKNKIVPEGQYKTCLTWSCSENEQIEAWKQCDSSNLSSACTAKVLIEGKMNY